MGIISRTQKETQKKRMIGEKEARILGLNEKMATRLLPTLVPVVSQISIFAAHLSCLLISIF